MSSSLYLCLLLFISFFHLFLSNQNFNNVLLCKDVERQALLDFKHGLVDHADRLASWVGENNECCNWVGIICDNVTGHVYHIRLRGVDGHCHRSDYTTEKEYNEVSKKKLGGDLSPSLLRLNQLRHLDLSCNDFRGIRVPSFMGSFRKLRYLNLSSSSFGGMIPPQLGNLSELQVLSLGSFYDGYESTPMLNMKWLSNLRLLHHLDMSGIDLNKAIDWLQVMNFLPSLIELHLSNCQLSHMHPDVPSLNLTSLSLLDLSGNYFYNTFVPRWIFSLTSLVSLDLSMCNFQGVNPGSIDTFRNLTSLKVLHVSGNNFMNSSLVLKGLSSTIGSNLISLDIRFCNVSSSSLDSLYNLTSLLSLDLSHNQLTKSIPKSLGNLCNLREIDLSSNNFHNISLAYLLESFFECKSPSLESLFLWSSGLSGHLPNQLGQLIHLVHLNLGENNFVGIIPDSIANLSFLRSLQLYQSSLSGPLPYSIGGLSSLEMLDVSHNRLNGSLPDSLGLLLKLDQLDLSYNQFTGSLPGSLGQLSKLNSLDLSSNLLTGVVTEAHLAKLSGLKYLNGTGNKIILRPQLANWIPPFQLQYLYLNSWVLGPQFPFWLQFQRDLVYLEISNTNISAPMPRSFWSTFPNLTYLDMSHNHFRGMLFSIPATLDMLDLSYNEFTGKLPHLSSSSGPKVLDLSNNFFTGSLHHLLCTYDQKLMKLLNLGNNNLSGVVPDCWEKWSSLSLLNLENNNLFGQIPKTLGLSSELVALNLCGNKLSGRLPASLMNLTSLLFLQLGRNELVGSIPTWIGTELSSLVSLELRSNNFDGNIPQELCYLTKIHILALAENNLSGSIPECFNNFSVLSGKETGLIDAYRFYPISNSQEFLISQSLLVKGREDIYSTILGLVTVMDLSSNNISGHIPRELTALVKLKSLNLERNQLTGKIPENIGDMKSLEYFDLSSNNLSGELPVSLSSLSFLSKFNVSYNNLMGRIPSGTQLQGLNESSFFGNNLCGDPLTKRCVVEVPDQKEEEEEEKEKGSHGADLGLIISIVFGFIGGFWIIVAPFIVNKSWSIAYFRFLTRLMYMVYDVMHKFCCKMFPKC